MSDFPLRKLPANDPENLLSPEARQRIQRMYHQVARIKLQAEQQAMVHYEAEADQSRSFDEFISSGQTSIDLANAKMEAARESLRVVQEEFQKLNLPDREFDQIIQGWLEAVANSLELSMLDRELLVSEIICARLQRVEDKPGRDRGESNPGRAKSKQSISSPEGVKRIRDFMTRNALTQSQFAEKAHIGEKTLYRLLSSGQTIPRTWTEVANAMGIRPDELIKS